MDIAQYISDLLNEHDEVGLSGIGTFFKKSASAYFNTAEGVYYPPTYKIDFREEEGSSTILINHIIQNKHISEPSALYFIERFSENIKNSLNKTSSAGLLPLGTLLKTDAGYTFQADSATTGAEFFGLKPLKEPEPVTKAPSSILNQSVAEGNENLTQEPSSGLKSLWITLSILLLVAAIASFAYFKYPQYFKNLTFPTGKKPGSKVVKPVVVPPVKDSVSFADSIVNELEKQGMNAEVEKARDTVKISSNITKPDSLKANPVLKPARVYEIIVASSGLRREAEASARRFRKKGIDAKVLVDTRKPRFKVSAGTLTSKNAANKEHARIKKDLIRDAWILTITNKEN